MENKKPSIKEQVEDAVATTIFVAGLAVCMPGILLVAGLDKLGLLGSSDDSD